MRGACWGTTATLLAKRSRRKGLIQRLAEFRHALPCRLMIGKEGEVMPPYLMPLPRSGVIRPCGSVATIRKSTMGLAIHLSMVRRISDLWSRNTSLKMASFRPQTRTITSVGLVLCEIFMNLMSGQRVATGHVLRS